ncbi:MAG: EFR1 family ferrodoxin [Bacillota bacterium]
MKVFYFSGSGNSLAVAKQIGGEDVINMAVCCQKEFKDDSIGFVFPVYCYDIPFVMRNFLKSVKFDAKYIWAVATCGSSVGYSFKTVDKLLKKQGRALNYCKKIVLPDSCIAFKTPPYKQKAMLESQNRIVKEIKEDLLNKKILAVTKDKPFAVNKIAWWGMKYILGAKFKKVNDNCNKCGVCVDICPVNNIKMLDKPIFNNKCEYCFACIQWCNQRAIEFGKLKIDDLSKYTHPIISVKEMIKRNNI